MADFFVHRSNVGTSSLPQFQVTITMTNCGLTSRGEKKLIPTCATIEELDEEVDRAIQKLNEARGRAKGILEENQ